MKDLKHRLCVSVRRDFLLLHKYLEEKNVTASKILIEMMRDVLLFVQLTFPEVNIDTLALRNRILKIDKSISSEVENG